MKIMTEMFLVGGAVRDMALAVRPKDYDFTVVANDFDTMKKFLMREYGVEIFLEIPEFGTIRGRFARHQFKGYGVTREVIGYDFADIDVSGMAADFVLARKESHYTDGRHPDSTQPGTLLDDLKRRDFTVNAMALDKDGTLIDPFNGAEDLAMGILKAVGYAQDRLDEDALRAIRALRFIITKGLVAEGNLSYAMSTVRTATALRENISEERVREELLKCFKHDTWMTLKVLDGYPMLKHFILNETNIWLKPTSEER